MAALENQMRDLACLKQYRNHELERKAYGPELSAFGTYQAFAGCFDIPSKVDGESLRVTLSKAKYGWDHVSVSRKKRTPTWGEMEQVRRLCFEDNETVMQYHAPVTEYVDGSKHGHPFCLHLWRPINDAIPKPPIWMVGGMTFEEADKLARKDGF